MAMLEASEQQAEDKHTLTPIDHVKVSINSHSSCTAISSSTNVLFRTKGVSFAPSVFHVHCFVRVVFHLYSLCFSRCLRA